MFTLKQLKYFITVAEAGSVTDASKQLFVSQPAISSSIRQLEETFGVELFIRHKAKGVGLTPAGQSLLVSARELISHADDVLAAGHGLNSSTVGPLQLGSFHTVGPHVVPNLLARFRHDYPGVQVYVNEGNIQGLQSRLMDGQIELAVIYNLHLDKRIESVQLMNLPPYAIVPRNDPIARLDRISLKKLAQKPMIMLDLPHSRDYFSSLFRDAGITPRIDYYVKSVPMVRAMVANGLGYSILNFRPKLQVDYANKPVSYVDLEESFSGLNVLLAWPAGARLTSRARLFIEAAQLYMRSTPTET